MRTVSNFFENSRRYSQVKVHHRYQRHRWQICHRCQWHRWQFCLQYQRHRRQIFPPVSTTPAANFAASFTSVVDTSGKLATGVIDTGGKWEQNQAADTLKWTWRQKFIYMLTLLSQGVPTKLLKLFWFKIFFIYHRCQPWAANISANFRKKFETALMVYSGAWGKMIHEKHQKLKILWHCPFNN